MEIAQPRGAKSLLLTGLLPCGVFTPARTESNPHLRRQFCVRSEVSYNSSQKNNPSKVTYQKKMKSYKQKLLSFALLCHCRSHKGQSWCSGVVCMGYCKASLAAWSLGKMTTSTPFSGVTAALLLRQTGLLPFHAQFACLSFRKGRGFFVLCASL